MRRMGFNRRREMAGSKRTEASLVEAMLIFLNLQPNTFAWRMETDGKPRRNPDGSFRLVRNRYGRGKPDICGVKNGRGFVIEAKMPGGKAAPHQREWLDDYVRRGGGVANLCHSVDDVESFWEML